MVTADGVKRDMATKIDSDDRSTKSESRDSPVSAASMSLDVLAQVASDRLQTDGDNSEPRLNNTKSAKRKKEKPAAKRSFQTMDRLHLYQIEKLSDKLLIAMFSEMTADELRKIYTVKCALEPGICLHQVTVYGNEMNAKNELKHHLHNHILQLKETYKNDPEGFTAETSTGRKKRLLSEYNKRLKMKKKMKKEPPPEENSNKRRGRPPSFPQTLHDYAGLGVEIDKVLLQKDAVRKDMRERELETMLSKYPEGEQEEKNESNIKEEPGNDSEKSLLKEIMERTDLKETNTPEKSDNTVGDDPDLELSKNSDLDTEQLVIDLMNRSQPYQDHNYTSVLGKKKGIESMQYEYVSDDDMDPGLEVMTSCRTQAKRVGMTVTPDVLAEMRSSISIKLESNWNNSEVMYPVVKITPLPDHLDSLQVSKDGQPKLTPEIIAWEHLKRLASKMTATQKKSVYPPMPSTNLDKQGRIPEESLMGQETQSGSEDEQEQPKMITNVNPYKRGRRSYDTMGGEWERRAALKCIRELRLKKKEDTSLVCKICKNRTFTATATLMYHYRSHAGIKPFVCLICNTTFTRQHSLNYHMLIHNNQSRFTCRECGRKFRHPSHFKEHMRRHTGETPYHCTDCPLRFKTRNTYKRHLKTRHDKVLTAVGIRNLTRNTTVEESPNYIVKTEDPDIEDTEKKEDKENIKELQDETVSAKMLNDLTETNAKSLTKVPAKVENNQEQTTIKPTPVNDIAGIQSIVTNTAVQFKVKPVSSSPTSPTIVALPTQVLPRVNTEAALQLQIPQTQTVTISGIQLQLASQQLQLPNTQFLLPVNVMQPSTGDQTAASLQLPLMQATTLNQSTIPAYSGYKLPLIQDSTITQPVTPLQIPVVQSATVLNQPTTQLQIPVVQPTSVIPTQAQYHFVQAKPSNHSGTSVQVLQTPTVTQFAQMTPGSATQFIFSNPVLQPTMANTPAANTLLRFCTQVANQVPQVTAINNLH